MPASRPIFGWDRPRRVMRVVFDPEPPEVPLDDDTTVDEPTVPVKKATAKKAASKKAASRKA